MEQITDVDQFIKDFRGVLNEVLTLIREKSKLNLHPIAQAGYNAKWEMIDLINIFLAKKETPDMQDLKAKLLKQVIGLDELAPVRKHSEIEDQIKVGIEVLEQLMRENKKLEKTGAIIPARSIIEDIEWGHFSSKVSQMREDGKIGRDITTKKRGEDFFLAKLPKGETVQPRRSKVS